MEQQAREQAFITALVTEHFVLQSARSATIGEANGRASIYLSVVSSALVAFGFLAQVATRPDPFVAAVLPALFILGEFTYIRLVDNGVESLLALQRIHDYCRDLMIAAVNSILGGAGLALLAGRLGGLWGWASGAGRPGRDAGLVRPAPSATGCGHNPGAVAPGADPVRTPGRRNRPPPPRWW
jgi:hypothetical protein